MVMLKAYRSKTGPGTKFYEARSYAAAVVAVMAFTIYQIFPTSYWFEVRNISVDDIVYGKPVILEVDRSINREFYADWTVNVRRIKDANGINRKFIACPPGVGGGDYLPEAAFPDKITLVWWSGNADCFPLPVGKYRIETVWTIHTVLMGDRVVRAYSNEFEVTK